MQLRNTDSRKIIENFWVYVDIFQLYNGQDLQILYGEFVDNIA